ncbi:MBL fold metallo-hydrolase [Patescibacteria group bacterium]|nr:MBL fold metallo-hydrolase [Patescibacteria group bacterium]
MAEVKILVEGYTTADSVTAGGKENTCPTITLVRDKNTVMVVDPGVLKSQKILIDALKKEKLAVGDVNVVCITHSHIDHYRNIGMFPKAKTLEIFGLWDKNTVEERKKQFTDNIRIIETPGHDYTSITILVNTGKSTVAICGDVFWKKNMPERDQYALDQGKLKESRKKVLKIAGWIIPGHGPMYKVVK